MSEEQARDVEPGRRGAENGGANDLAADGGAGDCHDAPRVAHPWPRDWRQKPRGWRTLPFRRSRPLPTFQGVRAAGPEKRKMLMFSRWSTVGLSLVLSLLSGCAGTEGSGVPSSEERVIGSFDRLEIRA